MRWTDGTLKPPCMPLSKGYDADSLITERVSFENYAEIYDNIGRKQHRLLAGLRHKGLGRTPGRHLTEPKTCQSKQTCAWCHWRRQLHRVHHPAQPNKAGAQIKTIASAKGLSGSIRRPSTPLSTAQQTKDFWPTRKSTLVTARPRHVRG